MKLVTLASVTLIQILAFGQEALAAVAAKPKPKTIHGAVNCVNGDYKSSEIWTWSREKSASFPWNPDKKTKIADGSTFTWEGDVIWFPSHGVPGWLDNFEIDKDAFSRPYNSVAGHVHYQVRIVDQLLSSVTDKVYVKKQQLDFDGWTCWVVYANLE
ncbi:hypothetical protein HDU86_002362 [Geranomyces michiganensis]|nr:hypothetical protein HDU86_002362 [Geranomyces michiganensis]